MKIVSNPEPNVPIPSAIARLLEELSWGGKQGADRLRGGGRYLENVLTAEVLQALDFLPRNAFLAQIFRAASGADLARERHAAAAEDATVTVLPGPMACAALDPGSRTGIDTPCSGPATYP